MDRMNIGDKVYKLKWDGLEWRILPGKVTHKRTVEEVRVNDGCWRKANMLMTLAEARKAQKEKNKK